MGKLVSWVAVLYFATCVFAIPNAARCLWFIAFSGNKLGNATGFLLLSTWIVVGAKICMALARMRNSRIESKAKEVTPGDFVPQLEIKGLHGGEYIGFDNRLRKVVLVDIRRKYAACKTFDFIQGWTMETIGDRASIIFSFNSLEFSTLKIPVGVASCDDLAAKLNFVL